MEDLHGDTAKIDALSIKKYADQSDCDSDQYLTNAIESVFSTRLSEEAYCGLINLMYAFAPKTSIDDIEKGLVSHIILYNSYLKILSNYD